MADKVVMVEVNPRDFPKVIDSIRDFNERDGANSVSTDEWMQFAILVCNTFRVRVSHAQPTGYDPNVAFNNR